MIIREYDRQAAVEYARTWALKRNPAYLDFSDLGGDCTNYVSQCVYAGAGVMNYTPVYGWFYKTADDRTASWTGVEFFYNFMTQNKGQGPFGRETTMDKIKVGDLIQLGRETGDFYHTPIVTAIKNGKIYVCAHTYDALDRALDTYSFSRYRCIHIDGVRVNQ